jgi:nucleoside-diphosphate-sugar epimerase
LARALVTGGAGFIGFHLATALAERGHEVTICDDFSRGHRDEELEALCECPNVRLVDSDLTRPDGARAIDGAFDHVYHLAAVNGTRRFYEMPERVLRVNLLALLNLLDLWAEGRWGKLLFASSSEVYAGTARTSGVPIPTPEDVPLVLDDPRNPRLSYGASKALGELLVINYGRATGLLHTTVRYHNVYGPRMGDEHVIPQFCDRVLRREDPFAVHGAEESRAFCYVDDAVRATTLLMESPAADGQTVHVGDPTREISAVQLASLMFDLFDFHPALAAGPAPEGSVKRRCPDIARLSELTGFRPETTLEDGLRRTFRWYKQRFAKAAPAVTGG